MATHLSRFNTTLGRFFLLGCIAVLALATPARAAWWNSEWTLRKKITLDPSAAGPASTDATGPEVVLVRLYDGNFKFASAKPDASDLRFVADDGKTQLSYHIEKIDPLLNEAFVWVKIPELKPGVPNTLSMYYGNAGTKVEKVENSKATYDEHTMLVYHFSEHGQPAADSSGNGNHAQTAGLSTDSSQIGSGLRIDGKTTVTIPASPSLFWTEGSAMTWSAWVKFGAAQPNAVFFSRRDGNKYFLIGADNGVPYVEVTYQGSSVRSSGGAVGAPNAWQHLAVVATGERISLYVNGQPHSSVAAPLPALNGPMVLGGDGVGGLMNSSGGSFSGEMDELQIANVARSEAALRLVALSQGGEGPGKFITFGEDEQETSWLSALKGGYIGVIVSNLSFDGWVVIGILSIMFIISWAVMISKAKLLTRVAKGNQQFLEEWSHVANDLSVLEEGNGTDGKGLGSRAPVPGKKAMTNTPLYRIYHIGVGEIQHRISADHAGASKVLSGRSIQAIRATLDGGLVRETQKLNNSMVLLTIAISGGPFLGLLGTVVGVMITFAAVAQAGEVNVNAIAPGIAAALLATVAGLGVAIPALFGYNYLLTRIKSTTTDMHVFIDEFVTKLAEFYAGPSD